MISTKTELTRLVDKARQADSVALDTEFIWERTFYPELGLIQVALSDEDCYLIDPLAVEDLTALGSLLADRQVVKILHDAPQDLAILSRATGANPVNVFDTRLAAGFAGLPSTISLVNLISALLDIRLTKTQTRTNWKHRPLNQEQIAYALDDVRYLRALRVLLLTRIIVPEIRTWLHNELELLNDPATYAAPDDHERYLRINGAGTLNRRQLAVLKELTAWREREARHLNRPRGHVLTDSSLLALAKSATADPTALRQAELLSSKKEKQYGNSISKAIRTGLSIAETDLPERIQTSKLKAREKKLFERLLEYIKLKCDMQGIDPQLVATTAELKQLAKNLNRPGTPLPPRLTGGWRKLFLEEFYRQRD